MPLDRVCFRECMRRSYRPLAWVLVGLFLVGIFLAAIPLGPVAIGAAIILAITIIGAMALPCLLGCWLP